MPRHGLSDMKRLTDAVYQQERQALSPLFKAEARVLGQIARLDEQMAQSIKLTDLSDGYRASGTEVLWRGWAEATRRKLNIELARLRAQKLARMETLRAAFGRKQAVEKLAEKDEGDRRARSRRSF